MLILELEMLSIMQGQVRGIISASVSPHTNREGTIRRRKLGEKLGRIGVAEPADYLGVARYLLRSSGSYVLHRNPSQVKGISKKFNK